MTAATLTSREAIVLTDPGRTVATPAAFPPFIDKGELVAEKFRVYGKFGSGQEGDVYRAEVIDESEDQQSHDSVALKIRTIHTNTHLNNVQSEAAVCKIMSGGTEDSRTIEYLDDGRFTYGASEYWYLATKEVPGETFDKKIMSAKKMGGFSIREFKRVMIPVSRAIADMHKLGLVHRDVKPSNIYVGNDGSVRLGDFGIAAVGPEEDVASSIYGVDTDLITRQKPNDLFYGSPHYTAPERVRNLKGLHTKACDVFSLGSTMHYAATGRPLVDGKSRAQIEQNLAKYTTPSPEVYSHMGSKELGKLIISCIYESPENRPKANQVAESLEEIAA